MGDPPINGEAWLARLAVVKADIDLGSAGPLRPKLPSACRRLRGTPSFRIRPAAEMTRRLAALRHGVARSDDDVTATKATCTSVKTSDQINGIPRHFDPPYLRDFISGWLDCWTGLHDKLFNG